MRSATSSVSLAIRVGRVLSRSRPSTPSDMNRSCQRQTAVLLTPAVRMIVAVPSPSAVASTIRARQTCFWGLLRSSTIACRRLRSLGLRSTVMPVRIPKTRTTKKPWKSQSGLLCQHQSTRLVAGGSPLSHRFPQNWPRAPSTGSFLICVPCRVPGLYVGRLQPAPFFIVRAMSLP